MLSRGFLAARPLNGLVQRRGMAAVKNWKRPSMDEYLAPSESWAKAYAQRQAASMRILAFGATFLVATIAFGRSMGFLMLTPMKPEIYAAVK